jgi:serine protease
MRPSECFRTATILVILQFISFSLFGQSMGRVPGELLIHTESEAVLKEIITQNQRWEGQNTALTIKKGIAPLSGIWLLSVNHTSINEKRFLEYLRGERGVISAQFNHILEWRGTPDDSNYDSQWQWKNTGQNGGTSGADLSMEDAWGITTGGLTTEGDTIVVVVVDDGVQLNHPDLSENLWINYAEIPNNGIDDDGNGYIDDYLGWNTTQDNDNIGIGGSHGTRVSGMIGAIGNNSIGVTGINWNIKIMTIRPISTDEATVVASYNYALTQRKIYNQTNGQQGAFVVAVNSSWGIDYGQPADAPIWCAFYDTMGVYGILNAAATANQNINVDIDGDLPTGCSSDYLISVTSTNRNDQKVTAGFGLTTIDLGAPGQNIYTTRTNNDYGNTSGTSFASPIVAGLVGLLYSAPCPYLSTQSIADPAGTALLIKDAIMNGVDPNNSLQGITVSGGRANAYKSLIYLIENCSACPPVSDLSSLVIDETTAEISWTDGGDAESFNLRWREVGGTIWTIDSAVSSPYTLDELLPCLEYEVEVLAVCEDEESGFVGISFYTEICCTPPQNLNATILNGSAVLFDWIPVSNALSYTLGYQIEGASDFFEISGISDSGYILDNLEPCTSYNYYLETACDAGITSSSEIFNFSTPGCQDCDAIEVCAAFAEDSNSEFIQSIEIGSLLNNSGNNGGYGDFLNLGADFLTFHKYAYILTPGFPSSPFNQTWRVWVDFNQNGSFDDEGELIIDTPASTEQVNGLFKIPGDALPGATKMRVAMRFSSPAQSCGSYTFGEVEDYCINIVAALPPCDFPDSISISGIEEDQAILTWPLLPSITNYLVEYRIENGVWASIPSATPPFTLQNLSPCTIYEVRVQADCDTTLSSFSPSTFFTTKGCGACLDNTYCSDNTAFSFSQYINAIEIAGINNISFDNNGYAFFDDLPIVLNTNYDYELRVFLGSIFGVNTNYYRVWIDYNQNGVYDLQELVAFSDNNNEPVFTNLEFTVPNNALEGPTRMRVVLKSFSNNFSPCDSGFTGEIEEYCINIVKAEPPCIPRKIDLKIEQAGVAELSWKEVIPSTSYLLEYRQVGEPDWINIETIETDFILTPLAPCTDYEVRMRTICSGDTTAYGELLTFTSFGCGACLDFDYCESRGTNSSLEWIQSVSLNTLNNNSGDNNGYQFFESITTSLDTGATYTITVAPGFNGFEFTENFNAWIDFNQNGIFESNESILSGASNMEISNTFTVPGVPLGETRLRVSMNFSSPMGSCSVFSFGEVEDYCIRLSPGEIPCNIPEVLDTVNVTMTSAGIYWDSVQTSVGYILRLRPLGAPDWEIETPVVGNSYVFNTLSACSEYEINLITICQNKLSDEGHLVFKTACSSSIDHESGISALRIFPNPFTNSPSLEFTLEQSGMYHVHSYDGRGTLIQSEQRTFVSGVNSFQINYFDHMPAGLYLINLTGEDGRTATIRLVKQ